MSIVRLESSDKVLFEVHYDVIKCSETIRKALQDLGDEDDFGVLPVPKVSSQILEMVLNWATYHKNDIPKVIDEDAEEDESMEKRTDDICAWDTNFLNVDQGILYEIILAANYLNIQNLLHTTYKTVANMIKGKTTEQIRQTFSLVNDFTPEEEEEMRREADWCKWD
ncbi:hypothetical protein KR059_003265 [Drosophila kikkawai]|nr:hypothetical protein KR059_003265 [Drosophila kikkawai]